MSGTTPQIETPQIEWYIARDGGQHGPISDMEMRKFVELGHLRATDLVWCPRFTEWQAGAQAFPGYAGPSPVAAPASVAAVAPASVQPIAAQAAAPAAGAGSAPQPSPAAAPIAATAAAPTPSQAIVPQLGAALTPGPGARPLHSGEQAPRTKTGPILSAPAQMAPTRANPALTGQSPAGQGRPSTAVVAQTPADDAAWAEAMRSVVLDDARGQVAGPRTGAPSKAQPARSGPMHARTPELGPSPWLGPTPDLGSGVRRASAPDAAPTPHFATGPGSGAMPGTAVRDLGVEEPEDDAAPGRRSWVRRISAVAAVMLIVGGLGWLGWQNRSLISGASAIGGMVVATIVSSAAPSPELFRTSPFDAPGETRDLIDISLQRTAVWRMLKRDFPEWYAERLADVERMRTQKQDDRVVAKFLADVIVTLRRRHAQASLQSSPEHLKRMAGAFVANLKQLASRDGPTCFGLISFGESSLFMLELSRTPAFAETLQKQLIGIFEAIADGRANRQVHPATRRSDYDFLTKELTARGWTPADLATFSDPQKLSGASADKVCALVQEWFLAQLAIKDADLQSRLLSESLKPLVGG